MINKLLNNVYVVVFLAVVGVAFLGFQIYRYIPKRPKVSAQQPANANSQGNKNEVDRWADKPRIAFEQVSWVERLKRNPFEPAKDPQPVTAVQEKKGRSKSPLTASMKFRLSAIWIQNGGRWAVLEDKIVGEDEVVGEYRVVAIYSDRVVLEGPLGRENVPFDADSVVGSAKEG